MLRTSGRTVHLTMTEDPFLARLVRAAFPDYRGRRITLVEQSGPVNLDSYWSEGGRTYHTFVRLSDLELRDVPDNGGHPAAPTSLGSQNIPDGFVLVQHIYFQGKELPIRILVPSANFNQFMLAAPQELTWAEKVVLVATRSLKSSYMGDSNIRFHESEKTTGIKESEWNEAKLNLINQGLLNRAGAITPKGRNAIEAAGVRDLYMLHNRTATLKEGTTMTSLHEAVVKLAKENATLRPYLVPILRKVSMEFPTQDALDKYLKAHPDADKANHRVVETEKPKGEKKESPAKVKLPKDIGNLMQDYAGGGDIFRQVGSFATGGHEVDADKVQEAIAQTKKYINITKNEEAAKSYGWGKKERGELEGILKALQKVAPKE